MSFVENFEENEHSENQKSDPLLSDISEKVKTDGTLRSEIRTLITLREGGWERNKMMFHKLLHMAEIINSKKKTSNRYGDDENMKLLKLYASYIFLKGGPSAYRALQLNSLLPSVSTVKKEILCNKRMMIGKIYAKDAFEFMIKYACDEKVVIISEDATRLKEEIEYDPETKEIYGLLPELNIQVGLPMPKNFDASTPSSIIRALKNFKMAPYVEIIMLKPMKLGEYFHIKFKKLLGLRTLISI